VVTSGRKVSRAEKWYSFSGK